MPKIALRVAGVVFSLVALLHLSRLIWKFDIVVAGSGVPIWANGLGFVVASLLAVWMWKATGKAK